MTLRALPNNRLVSSPAYAKILHQYNELLRDQGKVNDKKFYEEVVSKEVSNYSLGAWYFFLKRFKSSAGLIAAEAKSGQASQHMAAPQAGEIATLLLDNNKATQLFIQRALSIGADRAEQVMKNPSLLSAKEALDLSIKAMKAQDSRIHAIGKIREDNREQEKFDRTFSEAAF